MKTNMKKMFIWTIADKSFEKISRNQAKLDRTKKLWQFVLA